MKFNSKIIGVIIALIVFSLTIAQASTSYSVTFTETDMDAFPQIRLAMKISGAQESITARHLTVVESGAVNNGPKLLLPPSSPKNSVDLRILVDTSGNTKEYERIIKGNLKNFISYLKGRYESVNVNLYTFDNKFTGVTDSVIDSLSFSSGKIENTYGFAKISEMTSDSVGSEKIALIINGTQFYNDEFNQNFKNAVGSLETSGFKAFVVGYPLEQLYPLKPSTMELEDQSIFRSSYGGFLGAFGTDLTVIGDLLKMSYGGDYVFQYYSNLSPNSDSSAQVYIDDYQIKNIDYPAVSILSPTAILNTESEVTMGKTLPITMEIDPEGKLVNLVEMYYLSGSGSVKNKIFEYKRNDSTPDKLVFSGDIADIQISGESQLEDEYTGQYVKFYTVIHTPYDVISSEENPVAIPIFAYDDGINLHWQLHPNNKIKWYWDGPSVDEGLLFQLWAGSELLTETKDHSFIVSYDECSAYQVVKLRVSKVPKPTESDWGLFSRPGEVYAGQDGNITEKEGVEVMIKCLNEDKREAKSIGSFVQNEPGYKSTQLLNLEKMLYYFMGVTDSKFREEIEQNKGRFSLLYYLMNFINGEQYDEYRKSATVPRSILYKVITNTNHIKSLPPRMEMAKEELLRRLIGNATI